MSSCCRRDGEGWFTLGNSLLRAIHRPGGKKKVVRNSALQERLREQLPSKERRTELITLLQTWIDEEDSEEQRETSEYLIRALDEDRLSDRPLFPLPQLRCGRTFPLCSYRMDIVGDCRVVGLGCVVR